MRPALETKACQACAAAKRKCGRQMPHCLRCTKRRVECRYPASKPASFVLFDEEESPPGQEIDRGVITSDYQLFAYLTPNSAGTGSAVVDLPLPLDFDLTEASFDNQLSSCWFNSLDTWKIHRFPQSELSSFTIVDLKRDIRKLYCWFTRWVADGSNPIIHPRLYQSRFPQCVQDAYMALSCYIHKTASNEPTVLQLVNSKARQLLQDHGVTFADLSFEAPGSMNYTPLLNSLDHLARVQSLLIYQVLGLSDGDIQLRHFAQSTVPLMHSWMQQMVEHASASVRLSGSLILPSSNQTTAGFSLSDIAHSENYLWDSWVLAESIRRTYLITSGIHGVYLKVQQGWSATCWGCTIVTVRQGVWEAQSALEWAEACSNGDVMMWFEDSERLFTEMMPDDVNDFMKGVLETTFGTQRLERWGVQVQDREP